MARYSTSRHPRSSKFSPTGQITPRKRRCRQNGFWIYEKSPMHPMTNEASPNLRVRGQGGCGKSPVFKRIGHKAYRRGYWFLHKSCPCAVPMGLRNRLVESLFPTLKRGANQLCASGAFMPTFLMQSQYSFTLFCCIYGTTESLSAHCSAGFQTGCTGGFQAARDGGC